MTLEAKITLGIAILGAVTGTIALVVQLLEYWHDRAKIKLSGCMSLSSNIADPVERYEFQLDVVNKGRRVARISEIYIETKKEKPGAKFKIFDAAGQNAIALEEGETKRFGDRIATNSLDGLFESFEEKELFSVRLTTGEIHRVQFSTVKKSMLEKLRKK